VQLVPTEGGCVKGIRGSTAVHMEVSVDPSALFGSFHGHSKLLLGGGRTSQ
jgi:hypothetical protein